MANVLIYLLIYYMFIDCEKNGEIDEEKMIYFFVKSKSLFYGRLLVQNIKVNYISFFLSFICLIIGVIFFEVNAIILCLLIIMYLSNVLLQYHNTYSYTKYFIYILPMFLLFFNKISFTWFLALIILIHNVICIYKFKLVIYQNAFLKWKTDKIIKGKYLYRLFILSLYILFLIFIHVYSFLFPVEEILVGLLLYLITLLEVDLTENKQLLLKMKSRFNFIKSKSNLVSFNFFTPKQKNGFILTLSLLFITSVVLGVMKQNFFDYALLCIAGIVQVLYSLDYIIQLLILEKSIVYQNWVVKKLLDVLLYFVMFTYFTYFLVGKYSSDTNIDAININSIYIKLIYGCFYFTLFVLFSYRLHKCFLINDKKVGD